MKAVIVGLISLTVLSACTTVFKQQTARQIPPAGQGFCNANNGIFVIWVDNMGEQNAFLCPKIKGKKITQKNALPPGLDQVNSIDLGKAKKYKMADDPDPCVDWYVDSTHYYFCW